MPQGKLTNPKLADKALKMRAEGAQLPEIAAETELPYDTVKDIVYGRRGWDKRLKDPSLWQSWRRNKKLELQAASLAVASKALKQAEAGLDRASAYQAAGIYGLLRDKERLDAGEATAHVAVAHRGEVIAKLVDSLMGKHGDGEASGAMPSPPPSPPSHQDNGVGGGAMPLAHGSTSTPKPQSN